MLVIGGALFGAGLGLYRARKLGGKAADLAQYAFVYALGFGTLGVVATFIIHRSLA